MDRGVRAYPQAMQAGTRVRLAPDRVALVPAIAMVALAWVAMVLVPAGHDAGSFAAMWLTMTIAMMVPTVLRPMQRAADGSVVRAVAFLAGYAAPWLVAGLPAFAVMGLVDWSPAWLAFAWLIAGAYMLLPWTQRALADCRRVRFSGSPGRYGVRQGVRCVASCGPLMLAVMATAMLLPLVAGVALMATVTALVCWQKAPRTSGRSIAAVGVVILLGAALSFVVVDGSGHAPHVAWQGVVQT